MKSIEKYTFLVTSLVGAAIVLGLNALADSQPVLTIQRLGSNQFLVAITNGVSTNNYELHWTPVLGDANYPWQLLGEPSADTNWIVDGGEWPVGFFSVSIEQFYNGVPDYALADPNNPSLGALTITIDSPVNGSTIQ